MPQIKRKTSPESKKLILGRQVGKNRNVLTKKLKTGADAGIKNS